MKYSIFLFLPFLIISCQFQQQVSEARCNSLPDSTYFELGDSLYVNTLFDEEQHLGTLNIYQYQCSTLKLVQSIDSLEALFKPRIIDYTDYNSDYKKDILLYYGSGARGGNTLNYLFVRDSISFRFRYIRGSSVAPNLRFDTDRGVIESMRLTGTTTFEDYLIDQDSLIEIASVNVAVSEPYTIREYSEIKNGKYIVVRTDSVKDEGKGAFLREP